MLHIPILRQGRPYDSVDQVEIIHHATGEVLARVSQANSGLIVRDIRRMDDAVLERLTVAELIGKCQKAADLFMSATLPLLPTPVAELTATDVETLRVELLRACDVKGEPGGDEAARHYIKLDAAAESDAWADRLRAASAFPVDRVDAQKLWAARKTRAGGLLPWALDEECNQLFDAFRQGDRERALGGIGRVVHLATDASLPFRTVSDRTIAESPDLCASDRAALPMVQCHPVDRFEVVLPSRCCLAGRHRL